MDAIEFKNIEKKYKIYYGHKSIRSEFSDLFRKLFGKEGLSKYDYFALKNISFSVPQGTTLGLIGSNGSGKSTILKLITKVAYPSSGNISVNGRVASLLELGAGFHFELTGRENIYLNGALLGLTKKEIDSKFEEIVEFSELSKFIDTPIKKYSSGMYVRLGFAVAVHVNPEILLVDEVLAVGDANFQNKCIKKMREIVTDTNKTVILVSHNMITIQALCDKALWIEKGVIKAFDETNKVIKLYSEEINKRAHIVDEREGKTIVHSIHASEIKLFDKDGKRQTGFTNEFMLIELTYHVYKEIKENVIISFVFEAVDLELPIFSLSSKDKVKVNTAIGEHTIRCSVELKNIFPREYAIRVMVVSEDMLINYDTWYDSARFALVEKEENVLVSNINNIVKMDYKFLD